jgi:hypothetical protein
MNYKEKQADCSTDYIPNFGFAEGCGAGGEKGRQYGILADFIVNASSVQIAH